MSMNNIDWQKTVSEIIPSNFVQGVVAVILLGMLCIGSTIASADEFFTLKGHGGPVMDIAVSTTTGQIASASFDNSVGIWKERAPHWLDAHEASVNVVEFIDDNRVVSAGDDFSVIVWNLDDGTHRRMEGHTAKVMELAVSPSRSLIASASWDGRIGLWPLEGGTPRFLEGHRAGVSSLVFSYDGRQLYSASVDGTVRIWDVASAEEKRILVRNGFGINKIALGGGKTDGEAEWMAYGAVDGVTRIVDIASGKKIRDFTLDRRPILAMAYNFGSARLAVGDGQGYITIIDSANWKIERDFRAAIKGPIWALEFSSNGHTILAGGIESIVYAWPVDTLTTFEPMDSSGLAFLRDPAEMENGERQFARKCSICHSLTDDGERMAGPTLHKIMGRRAGTLEAYKYSDRLAQSELVWNEETIDLLFELGPDHYIPGSKMPMQQIAAESDRRDLIEFLKKVTQ